jgi:hypothetical protein
MRQATSSAARISFALRGLVVFKHHARRPSHVIDRGVGVFDIHPPDAESLGDARELAELIGELGHEHLRFDDREASIFQDRACIDRIAHDHPHHALFDIVDDA